MRGKIVIIIYFNGKALERAPFLFVLIYIKLGFAYIKYLDKAGSLAYYNLCRNNKLQILFY